ncbi:Hemocyte protein-glutamine gamma-glutamyltransferase-like protein, partial [Dinothrombium tinctorium]
LSKLVSSVKNVQSFELFLSYNSKLHHTNDFEISEKALVLRRAQYFHIDLQLKQDYDPNRDKIVYELTFGYLKPKTHQLTVSIQVREKVKFEIKNREWDARIYHVEKKKISTLVYIPPNAPVGQWTLNFRVSQRDVSSFETATRSMYILFNPWSPDDEVYIKNDDDRKEYVLNNVGSYFQGTAESFYGRRWFFAQNREDVFLSVIFILEKNWPFNLKPSERGSAVQLSRALSAWTNVNDDDGVLVGKWSEPYAPYYSPMQWTGSAKILTNYSNTAGYPVMYAQCWVFALVLTTICRTLGIPSRAVTNFASAHDTDKSLTVDSYFDSDGSFLQEVSRDSIWNFHVWTEAWMKRNDLRPEYSGWQVIDATPQEKSQELYRAGPASVKAVKNGDTSIAHDLPFVYAEVNADVYNWVWDGKRKSFFLSEAITDHIGPLIVTSRKNSVYVNEYEDITNNYKYQEGTIEERESFTNALKNLKLRPAGVTRSVSPTRIKIRSQVRKKLLFGATLVVLYSVKNKLDEEVVVNLLVEVFSVLGEKLNLLTKINESAKLAPNQKKSFKTEVEPDVYMDKLDALSTLRVVITSKEDNSSHIVRREHNVIVKPSGLTLSAEDEVIAGQVFELKVAFTNPKKKSLRNCEFGIEGSNYGPNEVHYKLIKKRETIQFTKPIKIRKPGIQIFEVNLVCEKFPNVFASKRVLVTGHSETSDGKRPHLVEI